MASWYKTWFDSPYYHILYKERDVTEARAFIDNLIRLLNPPFGSVMLDQACGRGRHAVYLNKLGFKVTGTDLSEKNIAFCKKYFNKNLQFAVHDMRRPFKKNYFDVVFNLFTSFGYFDHDRDQQQVVSSTAQSLKARGKYVIDFMNVHKVKKELVEKETKTVSGINFKIERKIEGGFIRKKISFSIASKINEFEENVEMIELDDFERFFKKASMKALHVFGSYDLEKFNRKNSDRLIIIAGNDS